MAAPELSERCRGRRRLPVGGAAGTLTAYAALWTATLGSATVVALARGTLARALRRSLAITFTSSHDTADGPARILALAAHNIPITAWPLLLGLIVGGGERFARRAADILVSACLLANTLPVGAALGAYGTALLPYLPQLPIEWAGLAIGYGSWLIQRRRAMSTRERLDRLALIVLTLVIAAALENLCSPAAVSARADIFPGSVSPNTRRWTSVRCSEAPCKKNCRTPALSKNLAGVQEHWTLVKADRERRAWTFRNRPHR